MKFENEVNEAPMNAVNVLYRVSDAVGVAEEHPLGETRRLEEPLDPGVGQPPVKNNRSTALIAANSAAPPAKNSRMASGLPQTRRVTGEETSECYYAQAFDGRGQLRSA